MAGSFSFVKSIYSLDTLDTRFTSTPTTPYKYSKDARIDPVKYPSAKEERLKNTGHPSKWRTTEFYFYYFAFVTVVPYMFWVAYDASSPSNPNYTKYEHLLSPGWFPGRKIDLSDSQYSTFRRNLPYLAALLVVQPLLRRLYNSLRPIVTGKDKSKPDTRHSDGRSSTYTSASEGQSRLVQRTTYDFGFALFLITALHGISALKILLILYINFNIATALPKRYIPTATWIFNIAILFANELTSGFRFAKMASLLDTSAGVSGNQALLMWGAWLDSYGGLLSRWEILFNISVLRMISFNLDYYWSLDRRGGSPEEKKQLDPANLSEKDRIKVSALPQDYSFRNYLAYVLYSPLYLAGPIITFNEYVAQCKHSLPSIETARTIRYAVRFLLVLLSMELVLHFDYVLAISNAGPDWSSYSPTQLLLLAYFNLHIIWLKLLLPFRLFRLWSLVDGIDPPENMIRCISDSYSTTAFWRAWHRSFNRWLTRYIYIPLGGSDTSGPLGVAGVAMNYLLIFTFVALWHDIKLNLLIWGWLIILFMLPELAAKYLFPWKSWEQRPTAFRMLSAMGGVMNIFMMMTANMVGFAVGLDGLKSIVRSVFMTNNGFLFLLTIMALVFIAIQIMLEIRQSELRGGIALRC